MQPTDIKLHKRSRTLELTYPQQCFELTAEYLRVHSPSAEVRGHGIGPGILQSGKQFVALEKVEPAGHYALKLVFNDGHDSGLYTWDYLYDLCIHQERYWQAYLERLAAAGASRNNGLISKG